MKKIITNVYSLARGGAKTSILIVFVLGLCYGILVGKYQFPPFQLLSDLKTYLKANFNLRIIEHVESLTPKGKEEKTKIEKVELLIDERAKLLAPVLDKILPVIYSAQKKSPPFKVKLPAVIGYTKRLSFKKGSNVEFFIHSENSVKADLFWLGSTKEHLQTFESIGPLIQSDVFSPETGFDWTATMSLPTESLKPGIYLFILADEKVNTSFEIPFVITSNNASKISVIASTNTWSAYNNYAGKSFYVDSQTVDSVKLFNDNLNKLLEENDAPRLPVHLPFSRPFVGRQSIPEKRPDVPYYSHLVRGEWTLLAFLEKNDIKFSVFADEDLLPGSDVFESDIIVFNCHNEYWTADMLKGLKDYIRKGGKVLFSGGNNIYKEVKYNKHGIELVDSFDAEGISPLIGTFFHEQASPFFASYEVKNHAHWVFKGTGLKRGDEFGKVSLNHREEESHHGASGWEADQISEYSKDFVVLAKGTNAFGPAHMVIRETESGGWVFNASSIPFTGALFVDEAIGKIMLNLLSDS